MNTKLNINLGVINNNYTLNKIILMLIALISLSIMPCNQVKAEGNKVKALIISSDQPWENSVSIAKKIIKKCEFYGYSGPKIEVKQYRSEENGTTVEEFESWLDNYFAPQKEKDISYFYYVGHSAVIGEAPYGFLLKSKTSEEKGLAYPFDKFIDKITSYKGKKILIIDSCYSGYVIEELKRRNVPQNQNILVMTATADNQVENLDMFFWGKYLAYTRYLGEATGVIESEVTADQDGDNRIALWEIRKYSDWKIKNHDKGGVLLLEFIHDPQVFGSDDAIVFDFTGEFNGKDRFQFQTDPLPTLTPTPVEPINPAVTPVPGVSITLDKKTLKLNVDQKETLMPTVSPEDAKVSWKSSDKSIATVNKNGKVTGIADGKCTITASITVDGKTYKDKCKVTVVLNPSITLNKQTLTLTVGEKEQLKATVVPKGTKVTWTPSKKKVAKVTTKGVVKAKKAGKCTITASIKVGKKTYKAKCKVTVVKKETINKTLQDFLGTYYDVPILEDNNNYCLVLYMQTNGTFSRAFRLRYATTGTTTLYDYTSFEIDGNKLTCYFDGASNVYGSRSDIGKGKHVFILQADGSLVEEANDQYPQRTWYRDKGTVSNDHSVYDETINDILYNIQKRNGFLYIYKDINRDGVDDLIANYQKEGSGSYISIYTYDGSAVKNIMDGGGYGINDIKYNKNCIRMYGFGHGGEWYRYYFWDGSRYDKLYIQGRQAVIGGAVSDGEWTYSYIENGKTISIDENQYNTIVNELRGTEALTLKLDEGWITIQK